MSILVYGYTTRTQTKRKLWIQNQSRIFQENLRNFAAWFFCYQFIKSVWLVLHKLSLEQRNQWFLCLNEQLDLQCWLVEFYSISTLVGYLMPNLVYKYMYIRYIICKRVVLSVALFLDEPEPIRFHTYKLFQVLASSIYSFIYTQLHGFNYC